MMVCILAYRIDSLTYTIAKALSYGGYDVFLQSISQEHVCDIDTRLSKMLASTPQVTVATSTNPDIPQKIGHLIIQGHPELLGHRQTLDLLARRTKKLTIISSGDRKFQIRQSMLSQWREICWYGRALRQVKRVVYKDGFYPTDLFGLLYPRRVIGFDVHSKFLSNQEAFGLIHTADWDIEAQRPILTNFLGSRDPKRRACIVDSVQPYFSQPSRETPSFQTKKTMFWHMFSDASPNSLGTTEYLDVLVRSDFTLCPPGYSLVTHRPLEALLRGSIPVLHSNELDLYDIGLQDGVNCISVAPEQWPAAIERLSQLDEDTLVAMRRNIFSMIEDRLNYPASSKRMRIRLGLEY